jgi:hypothetical protein
MSLKGKKNDRKKGRKKRERVRKNKGRERENKRKNTQENNFQVFLILYFAFSLKFFICFV